MVGQEFRDWTNVTFSKQTNVPDSCCLSDVAGCGAGVLGLDQSQAAMKIHTEGCLDIFTGIIQGNIGAVGGLGLGVGFLQVTKTRIWHSIIGITIIALLTVQYKCVHCSWWGCCSRSTWPTPSRRSTRRCSLARRPRLGVYKSFQQSELGKFCVMYIETRIK